MDLQAINEVKVTYQGQGHTSRSRSNQGQHQIEVIFKERYSYAGGLHLNQMRSCSIIELYVFTKLRCVILRNICRAKYSKDFKAPW